MTMSASVVGVVMVTVSEGVEGVVVVTVVSA